MRNLPIVLPIAFTFFPNRPGNSPDFWQMLEEACMLKRMKVALIGCGMISETYLKNLQSYRLIELAGCSDIRPERSRARAEAFGSGDEQRGNPIGPAN